MAAAADTPPRFFKVFISHFSSDFMLIPDSYHDELPRPLPKTAILQGTGGCVWNVAMKKKRDEVFFGQGWTRFVEDNSLSDGDFLTFVYDGDSVFEVSIYGSHGCKEARAVTEVVDDDEEEDSISSLGSDDIDTSSESAMAKNRGKKKVDTSVEDSDSDIEAFGRLNVEESSDSDSSYYEDTNTHVKPKATNAKNKGKSKLTEDDVEVVKKKRERVKTKIKDPEAYLSDPTNPYFETGLKKRRYELLVHAQLVKDYNLKFPNKIIYKDPKGELEAKTVSWGDERVCIKKFDKICERSDVKKQDRILCELLRKRNLVYKVKVHIVKEKDL